jgi:hypothetical protein
MSNLDYQAQLTLIYNKLAAIQADLAKLALTSNVNSLQEALQTQLNIVAGKVNTLTTEVETIQLTMNDLIIEMRTH